MFKTISRLLFGEEEETPEDVKSGEALEEDWLVISHQEADSGENQGAELIDSQPSNSALRADTAANMEADISVLDPESLGQSSSATSRVITDSFFQRKALMEATKLTCIQKVKTWEDRQHMTRNAIQRQNRVRHGVHHHSFHHHSFHLQQPGHRSLSH